MRLSRQMHGDSQAVGDVVAPGALQHFRILWSRPMERHIAPSETRRSPMAEAVHGIRDAEAVLVEPMRKAFGIIVETDALVRGCKKIDMMADREPGAAHASANLAEDIDERVLAINRRDVVFELPRGLDCAHSDPLAAPAASSSLTARHGPCFSADPQPSQAGVS
jgi:hypothetical protein